MTRPPTARAPEIAIVRNASRGPQSGWISANAVLAAAMKAPDTTMPARPTMTMVAVPAVTAAVHKAMKVSAESGSVDVAMSSRISA